MEQALADRAAGLAVAQLRLEGATLQGSAPARGAHGGVNAHTSNKHWWIAQMTISDSAGSRSVDKTEDYCRRKDAGFWIGR